MKANDYSKYQEYANDVIGGKVQACLYVRQACQRYLQFFDRYEFRTDKADKAVAWIERLRHSVGSFSGQPFILLPYQRWIVYNVFGFYHPGTDKRVIHYIYIELARKNGKTALMAAICLYMLIADGEAGSEVELLANSREQAKICYKAVKDFTLKLDSRQRYLKAYRDNVTFDATNSFLKVLASDSMGNDGYNSYCFVLDEAHNQKSSELWDVMTSSQGMRDNYLAIIITTAGFNMYWFCYAARRTCIEILSGATDNDSQFVAIYTLDELDDWHDSSVWGKANPSLGVTVRESYLQEQYKNALLLTETETSFRTKNLNQWVGSLNIWLSADLLLRYTHGVDISKYAGQAAMMGVDLSCNDDLTAVAVMIPTTSDDDGAPLYVFKVWYFLPESALQEKSNKELYKLWHRKGELILTEGNCIDYDYITKKMHEIADYLLIDKVAYDSYNATQWAIQATEQGFPLEPYSQALWSFNRPTKEFERLLKTGRVIIDNNEITRWCFGNVYLKTDHNENVKPVKGEGSQNKIDGVIAMLECLGAYLNTPRYANSIYAV